MRQVPITSGGLANPTVRIPAAARLSKNQFHVKIHLVFHDEVACLAYLARERFGCHDLLGALALALMPVSEISEQCGFNNLNYFSRLFKARTGRTPRKSRK